MNDATFILFTTEEGGYFKAIYADRELYDAAVATGTLVVPRPDYDDVLLGTKAQDEYDLKFIAIGRVEENHDFMLGKSREEQIREAIT